MSTTLQKVKEEFSKHLSLSDDTAIDMILATLVGNLLLTRDPLWLLIVAPPSAGKSSFVAPCSGLKETKFIDDISERTLLSSYKLKGKNMSLLTAMKVAGQKIMVFSDFSSILSKNPVQSGEILAQMRRLYDGRLEKATGTGEVSFHGRVGYLGCATPTFYSFLEGRMALGDRFIYYWMNGASADEVRKKKSENLMKRLSAKQIEDTMAPLYKDYFDSVVSFQEEKGMPEFVITPEQEDRIHYATDFAVKGKAQIKYDFKTKKPVDIPEISGTGRDLEAFYTLLQTLQLMDAAEAGTVLVPVSDARIELVEKCAYSSINRTRRKVMEALARSDTGSMSASEIGMTENFGLEGDFVKIYLYPLNAVGLVGKQKKGGEYVFYLADDTTRDFVRRMAGKVKDPKLKSADREESGQAKINIDEAW
ncbi:MAG: hypothetical protein U1D31_03385 [Patescibacteria group bacterium]|nr:hypothetical protein [Patescibacteria group bacterium]